MRSWKGIVERLDKIGARCTAEELVSVDHRVIILLTVALVLYCVLTVAHIHTSSLAAWNIVITRNSTPPPRSVLAGTPKGVRADEWMIGSPFIFSQVLRGFPIENRSYGFGKVALVTSIPGLPVKHYTAFFKPQSWPFFLLDLETAFAAYWNFRIFALLIGFFLLLMIVSSNSFWLSLFGSLWLFFSGYVQWWFGIQGIDHLIALCFMSISALYIFFSRNRTVIAISGGVFVLFTLNLALNLYPAWQVAAAYLFLFVVAGYLLEHSGSPALKVRLPLKVVTAVSAAAAIGLVLWMYLGEVKETALVLLATEYPGKRIARVNGGNISLRQYFSGFFNVFYTQTRFPYGNVCESMTFLPLYPAIAGVAVKECVFRKHIDWMVVSLLSYVVLFFVYMCFGLPEVLTKYTLLDKTYGTRPFLGTTAANIALCAVFLRSRTPASADEKKSLFIGFAVFSFIVVTIFGWYWSNKTNGFLSMKEILLTGVVFSVIFASLLTKRKTLFCVTVLCWVITGGVGVNPISVGISSFFNKDLAPIVDKISRDDPRARWVAYGDNYAANYLKGLGANVFNGLKYVPDLEEMKILDPEGRYLIYYNRYAHIEFHVRNDDAIFFDKASAYPLHDHISIFVNPASKILSKLGVGYILLPDVPVGDRDYFDESFGRSHGMIRVLDKPVNGYWIWKRAGVF